MKIVLLILTLFMSIISCNKIQVDQNNEKNYNEKKYTKVISDSTNKLTNKIENLQVQYTVWGCACPNWVQVKDINYENSNKKFIDYHFYIEPANESLDLPIYFDAFRHRLNLKGQFYVNEDFPQGTIEMEEPKRKAKVFRYTDYEVIDNPTFVPDSKIETLILEYNAISCFCAQWSETKNRNNTNEKEYFWLEPGNENIINADKLFNGQNLPIKIKITGQIVSEFGFPKNEKLAKIGKDEEAKVFRYTKIEVLKN